MAVSCLIGHQRDAVGDVGVEIDPGQVSLRRSVGGGGADLMALEKEVRAIVVGFIRAGLVGEYQIGVFVRLGL